MKRIVTTLIVVFAFAQMQGQQLPIFSLYHDNNFVLNPAITGVEDHGILTASYRDQWSEMEGRPRTLNASYRTPIFRTNIGVGGHVMNDVTGPTSNTGVTATFAYHISFRKIDPFHWAAFLRKSKISFGIGLSAYHYRLKSSELVLENPNDVAVATSDEAKFLPNVGVGVYYYYDNFYIGYSSPQIIPLNVKFEANDGLSKIKRANHNYLVIGGRIPIGKKGRVPRGYLYKLYIEPVVWFKYVKGAPYQFDGYLRLRHKNIAWVGVGYRSSEVLTIDAGFMIKNQVELGYAYDMAINDLRAYLGNTHEFIVAYHFKSKQTRSFGVR